MDENKKIKTTFTIFINLFSFIKIYRYPLSKYPDERFKLLDERITIIRYGEIRYKIELNLSPEYFEYLNLIIEKNKINTKYKKQLFNICKTALPYIDIDELISDYNKILIGCV